MRLGLIARADNGGLGAMTWEFYRHLHPERTLVIDLEGRGRGPVYLERYPDAVVNRGTDHALPLDLVRDFCTGLDLVYTAETFYRSDFCDIARSVGCRTVLHAMPELWRRDMAPPDAVWAPTSWELHRLPAGTPIVPVPVARDRLPPRVTSRRSTLLHETAPAMLDRNGSQLVFDALPYVEHDLRLVVHGRHADVPPINNPRIEVEWRREQSVDYWDHFADDCDGLLLPRRYAGLSLPMQQAFSLGWPVISLALAPQSEWIPPAGLAPAKRWLQAGMVNGAFWVHTTHPGMLARTIDRAIDEWTALEAASTARGDFLAWERLLPEYQRRLEEVCAGDRVA